MVARKKYETDLVIPEELDTVFGNYLLDLKKKEVDEIHRAHALVAYRTKHGWSQRELARQLGMPSSTIADWERWCLLEPIEVEVMKKRGMRNIDIYRQLRTNITKPKEEYINKTRLDLELESSIKNLKPWIHSLSPSGDTYRLLCELRDLANRGLMRIDKFNKGK